jgi:hypothetical protein
MRCSHSFFSPRRWLWSLALLAASACAEDQVPREIASASGAEVACIAPTIANPSFEQPRISPPWQSFTDTLPGWRGAVDVHDASDLTAAEGLQIVDLNQAGIGRPLTQEITLTPGAQYELRFSHGVNHHCTNEARFAVRIGGVYRTYRSTTTLREEHLFFIAREAASSIQFESLTGGCGAATIDDVRVVCSTAPREWPNAESRANSDVWLTQHHDAISVMRPRIAVVNYANMIDVTPKVTEAIAGIVRGSRYHEYRDPSAAPFLQPQVVRVAQLRDSTLFTAARWATHQGSFWNDQRWLAGDFDGDGDGDVANVFGDAGLASIDVHKSNQRSFDAWGRWSTRDGGFSSQQKWLAADVTGDGRADLINVFNDGGLASIDVHRSTGTGFIRARWMTRRGGFWDQQQWLAADVTGDGRADLINVFNDGGLASIDVHASTGTGFTSVRWATQQGSFRDDQRWLAGDVTGDRRADVVNVFDDGGLASIDVHVSSGTAFASWGRWSTRTGGFWADQKWRIGDFDNDGRADLANVFGEYIPATGATLASVDVHVSTGTGFRFARWETRTGAFSSAQQWLVADVNGGGYRDLVNVFDDGGQASIDVHLVRANHSSVPRLAADPTRWDYAPMLAGAYAGTIGIAEPMTGRLLPLCELISRGDVHELWFYIDARDNTAPQALEVVESKQIYDQNGDPIPGRFEPCAGNGCFEGAAAIAAAACGRSVKIVLADASRGPGCLLHSLGHGFETLGGVEERGATQPFLPTLAADFRHFANFDLARLGLPFPDWYKGCRHSASDIGGVGCGADAPGSCMDYQPAANNTLHWRYYGGAPPGTPPVLLQEGDISAYDQGCGSVHFPPNARDDYDQLSCQTMLSTCESYGARDGAGGRDQPRPYDGAISRAYEASAPDCQGGWQIYWRQSFPGRESRAVNQAGIPIPNWWPFLYY